MEGFNSRFSKLVTKLFPTNGAYLEIGLLYGRTFDGISKLIWYRTGGDFRAVGIDPYPLFYDVSITKQQKVIPKKSADALKEISDNAPYALVLIDGCHCRECAEADFRRIWPYVQPGGFVLFHDYAPEQQGFGAQIHDDRPIEVCKAVDALRKEFTNQWREHPAWIGNRKRNNVADMGVFEKLCH